MGYLNSSSPWANSSSPCLIESTFQHFFICKTFDGFFRFWQEIEESMGFLKQKSDLKFYHLYSTQWKCGNSDSIFWQWARSFYIKSATLLCLEKSVHQRHNFLRHYNGHTAKYFSFFKTGFLRTNWLRIITEEVKTAKHVLGNFNFFNIFFDI